MRIEELEDREYNEFNQWLYNLPQTNLRRIRIQARLALDMHLADAPMLEAILEIIDEELLND